MFEIMIIDDDEQVRKRLKSIIDWENLPVHLCCEAGDSDTARELYLTNRPKIIIADINIPIISGLELAAELRKEDPELRFIIITGYNDFEVVQKSVSLNAVSLLSKPIFPDAINASLRKSVDSLEAERQAKASMDTLQRLIDSNLPQMQESYMAGLLRKGATNPALVGKRMADLKISCPGPYFVVVLAIVHASTPEQSGHDAVIPLLSDCLAEHLRNADCSMFAFTDTHYRLNCVISTSQPHPDDLIEEILTRAREQLLFIADSVLSAGIGSTVDECAKLHESYAGALTALNYQCILGSETITHYKNLERTDTVFHDEEAVIGDLRRMFRENNFEAISSIIRAQAESLSVYGIGSDRLLQHFYFEYLISISNEALRLGLDMNLVDSYAPTLANLFQSDSSEKQLEDVLNLTWQLMHQFFSRQASNSNHLVAMAKEYIQKNMADEFLNLDQVSNHIGLSRIYFCKLFHQVEGVSFSNYLKQHRVERAKQLLMTTNMKVFEISAATGFSNAKYFSYVFKQTVGQTPLEFQKRNIK